MTADLIRAARVTLGGETRTLDLDDDTLPDWVTDALPDLGDKLPRKRYEKRLEALQIELVKLQAWLQETGERLIIVFEGRDAAGKGGTIKRVRQHMNPRTAPIVALPKPTERQQTQWYFQRYAQHLPAAGEAVLFDRSWYNRAGVERVMGFATPDQVARFLQEAPRFEDMLIRDGIHLRKFWLNIRQATQIERFHKRRHDRLKLWKLSPMDVEALERWDAYPQARDAMLAATHTQHAPWSVVRADDKRRARLALMRSLLASLPYGGKDEDVLDEPFRELCGGPEVLRG